MDVLALISGLLLTVVAVTSLWFTHTGSVDWQLVRMLAPLSLVGAGVLGLAVSRTKN
ncbi:MAG TPA: hypothetical protein VFP89_12515 [Propionibacteriaceae bacterium]|nr:hypothetical protein [Propionibacteriaceae bacterium]